MGKRNKDDASNENGQPDEIERKRFEQDLPCAISPETVVLKADELANTITLRLLLKEEKREANAKFREKINHYDEEEKRLAAEVKTHTESRSVKCVEYLVTSTQKVKVVRADNGETVSMRDATGDDVQDDIEFPGDEPGEWTDGPNPQRLV
jgi:hypothetical protein